MLAIQNNPEDTRPCAIITMILPLIPHWVREAMAATINLMCDTEEYAIRALRSVWVMQMRLVSAPPQQQKGIK